MFLAMYRAMYAADRSTLVGSLPLNAPPPCRPRPPYVSTMIFRPVSPQSPCGPPVTKQPVGLMWQAMSCSPSFGAAFPGGIITSLPLMRSARSAFSTGSSSSSMICWRASSVK